MKIMMLIAVLAGLVIFPFAWPFWLVCIGVVALMAKSDSIANKPIEETVYPNDQVNSTGWACLALLIFVIALVALLGGVGGMITWR